jgi:hypothetical protein
VTNFGARVRGAAKPRDEFTPGPRERREQAAARAAAYLARFLEDRPEVGELRKARAAIDEALQAT